MPGRLFTLVWWQLHGSMHTQGIIQFKGNTTCLPSAVVSRTCSPRKTEGAQPAWRWDNSAQGHPRPSKTERGPPGNRCARVCRGRLPRSWGRSYSPARQLRPLRPPHGLSQQRGLDRSPIQTRGQPFCAL